MHFSHIARKALPDHELTEILFQVIDIEIIDIGANEQSYGLFGINSIGNSILCHVVGYKPYFCISAYNFTDRIDFFISKIKENAFNIQFETQLVLKLDIYGFAKDPTPFLKFSSNNINDLNKLKKTFGSFKYYETSVPSEVRFMIDLKLSGINWVTVKNFELASSRFGKTFSICQLEIVSGINDITSHEPIGEYSSIAPLRILSFDIECAGRKNIFPEPTIDPVIQIASTLAVQGSSENNVISSDIFTFKSCAHVAGSNIFSFETENELFTSWSDFLRTADPDVVIGYNITNFDFPYLIARADTLKISNFPFLGRIPLKRTFCRNSFFSSKAYGTRESKLTNLEGRLQFDILQVMQRDYKLRSYSLNSVSAHFLGEQKEDVPHSIISDLFFGDENTRRRLASYCLKDAILPLRLNDKLMCLINYIEMARVTKVPFNFLLTRGQQIKVITQLFWKAKEHDFYIPDIKSDATDDQYEGAIVIEPAKGFYKHPIATLDFASLYPSIMIAHNLCYTTLTSLSDIQKYDLSPEDYVTSPSGDIFVKSHIRKGLIPEVLQDLLHARKNAKQDLKKEKDSFKKAVLDGRQLALKISANSVYGFTGATVGKLPCIPVSQSVTAFGREMIELTQKIVENEFSKSNNLQYSKVIYGDTDSVMIDFGEFPINQVMRLGRDASAFISAQFLKPISLEFEKCYFPFLLINKKRYAGLLWTKTDNYDKLDTKGIETVRRDNCRLVQTLIDQCLKKILIDKDVEGAKSIAKKAISDLLQNRIDLSQLVISKALSKSGEDYAAKQAHVELAERMKKRDAGSAPALGDRVAYVIVKAMKGAAAYEKAEDPLYVLEHSIPIDAQYYLENQLSKPLLRIFEPLIKHPSELLAGDHTRSVVISAPTTGLMSKFAKRAEVCLGCKALLESHEKAICKFCKPDIQNIYLRHLEQQIQSEKKFAMLWTQCQRCQGSLHLDVICTNRDCPIFYMRRKAQKDIKDASELVNKFSF